MQTYKALSGLRMGSWQLFSLRSTSLTLLMSKSSLTDCIALMMLSNMLSSRPRSMGDCVSVAAPLPPLSFAALSSPPFCGASPLAPFATASEWSAAGEPGYSKSSICCTSSGLASFKQASEIWLGEKMNSASERRDRARCVFAEVYAVARRLMSAPGNS